jgi:ssDNA-binding Zn-finger/Zn-ribbon topoisomerase 1
MAHDTDGPRKGEVEFNNGRPSYKTAVECPDCGFSRRTTEENPTLSGCPKCGTMLEYAD